MTNRSKDPRGSPRQPKRTVGAPNDLAAKFREWQRLKKQVRDFERAAAHNTKTIERHEREIENIGNEPDDGPENSATSGYRAALFGPNAD